MKKTTEPVLILIMKHMLENGGKIPKKFTVLAAFLQVNAIIYNFQSDADGSVFAILSPAHKSYFQQHQRAEVGPCWSRWFWTLRYLLFPSDDLDNLRVSINKVEAAALSLKLD